MKEFKVGNNVKCIDTDGHENLTRNKIYPVVSFWSSTVYSEPQIRIEDNSKIIGGYYNCMFKKVGGSMSNCEDLKDRIKVLVNGWDKDADDIIQEIEENTHYNDCGSINIMTRNDGASNGVQILSASNKVLQNFSFNDQCEKMSAFKKALFWLLDHSDIKKENKKREAKKTKIQEGIDTLQKQLDEME